MHSGPKRVAESRNCSNGPVYRKAAAVLVLDSGLYKSLYATAIEETLMRIECCRWMRRLWTFQEGVLPRRVFVNSQTGCWISKLSSGWRLSPRHIVATNFKTNSGSENTVNVSAFRYA
jgi:hypothetical protein